MTFKCFACLALLAACTSAMAAPPARTPAGDYGACNLPQGTQFRLARAGQGWTVSVRPSPSAAWAQSPRAVLHAVSAPDLAALNANNAKDARASWALSWEGAYFLRMPEGWTSQAGIRPDLVLVGAGQALMLCRID